MATDVDPVDIETLSREERVQLFYESGDLRFKMQDHQLPSFEAFWRWESKRQTKDYRDFCKRSGAQFDNLWGDQWSRRVGKTVKWFLIWWMFCAKYAPLLNRGLSGLVFIPQKSKIGGVLVPNMKKVFADAPPGFKPEYLTSSQGEHEHIYIPAFESRWTLVGLDKNQDALRGPFRDFVWGSEVGFVAMSPGLEETYVSEVQPQMQGLPHAIAAFETSKPKIRDHDWNRVFKPDCQLRGCYSQLNLDDNTSLSPEDIEDEIRKAGGRASRACKREFFNEDSEEKDEAVIPHFEEEVHVVDPASCPRPAYAYALEGFDEGFKDPLGYVAGYTDYKEQCFVVEYAFMKSGMSTGACVDEIVRPTELALWGTHLEQLEKRQKARDESLPVALQTIANAVENSDGSVWEAPYGALTFWDGNAWTLRPNPYVRVSDTAMRFILDLNQDYGLAVQPASKEPGSAEGDIEYLDELFRRRHRSGKPLIKILNNGNTIQLIQQLRSGRWKMRDDVHRVDFERSKLLGHLDCIAALKYLIRLVPWKRNPFPPQHLDLNKPGLLVPEGLRRPGASAKLPAGSKFGGKVRRRV